MLQPSALDSASNGIILDLTLCHLIDSLLSYKMKIILDEYLERLFQDCGC